MSRTPQHGFIALTSAIIVAAVLLLVAATGGLAGVFARGDALDGELKARSRAAAEACAERTLLALAADPSFAGGQRYELNAIDACAVGSVASTSEAYSFMVQATSSNAAVTDLSIFAKTDDLSILSWQEVAQW